LLSGFHRSFSVSRTYFARERRGRNPREADAPIAVEFREKAVTEAIWQASSQGTAIASRGPAVELPTKPRRHTQCLTAEVRARAERSHIRRIPGCFVRPAHSAQIHTLSAQFAYRLSLVHLCHCLALDKPEIFPPSLPILPTRPRFGTCQRRARFAPDASPSLCRRRAPRLRCRSRMLLKDRVPPLFRLAPALTHQASRYGTSTR
jgi:hypothetical protein